MVPLFRQELIEKRKYITEDELMDYYSIGQCTPGIIAVNVATFTGYKVNGIKGAISATFAMVFPSLIIIMMLAGILDELSDNQTVAHAFAGIRLGVIALIGNEVLNLSKKALKTKYHIFIFAVIALLLFGLRVTAIEVVVAAAVLGCVYHLKRNKQ